MEAACREALEAKLGSRDVVLNLLARRCQPQAAAPIATPVELSLAIEPVADCARYDRLRQMVELV